MKKTTSLPIKVIMTLAIFFVSSTTINALSSNNYLSSARDSLERLLKRTHRTDINRQVVLLNHLCDIDIELGDTLHLYPCWYASVKAHDIASMDDLLIPLAMRAMKRGQTDSVAVWEQRARGNMPAALAECNIQYIHMMRDISDWEHKDQLAKRMIKEQLSIAPSHRPYEAMRVLYTMGILASFEAFGNNATKLKSSEEYMLEALEIAKKQPFNEAFHFTRQILIGLSSEKVEYGKLYLSFVERTFRERYTDRPFYSRRSLIMAYDKLILMGKSLPRTELDEYYRSLCKLLKEHPNNTPIPLPYFFARVSYRYNKITGNNTEALRWCDSLINAPAEYHQSPLPYYEDKAELLASMNRWQEAYRMEQIYCAAKDSMQSINSQAKLEELQTQYDVDTLKRKEEVHRQQLIIAILAGALVLCALCFYIFYNLRIAAKNKILLKQLREHVHHLKAEAAEREAAINSQQKDSTSIVVPPADALPAESPATESPTDVSTVNAETEKAHADKDDKTALPDYDVPGNSAVVASRKLFDKLDNLMRETQLYLNPELNRNDLISMLGTNKNNLAAALAAGKQGSVLEYINNLRLNESLLVMEKQPDLPLTQVAEASGFAVYSSFYRAFCKRFGVNPAEYRRFSAS